MNKNGNNTRQLYFVIHEAMVVHQAQTTSKNAMHWQHLVVETRTRTNETTSTRDHKQLPLRTSNGNSSMARSGSLTRAPDAVTPNSGAMSVRHTASRLVRQSKPVSNQRSINILLLPPLSPLFYSTYLDNS